MVLIRQYLKVLKASTPAEDDLFIYLNKSALSKGKLWFSISNSPYPGHVTRRAVDLYSKFPYLPIMEGRVKKIIRIPSNYKFKDGEKDEWVTIISLPGGKNVLKVLHVKPTVKEGERLYLGDELGKFVRSYHFYSWTEPHMHLELRKASDPLRALGGYELMLSTEFLGVLEGLQCISGDEFIISHARKSYAILKPIRGGYPCAKISFIEGYLDGGIPHYCHGSILKYRKLVSIQEKDFVLLNKTVIGKPLLKGRDYVVFEPVARPLINGFPSSGIGYFLMREAIKLVSRSMPLELREGDSVIVSWLPDLNSERSNECHKLLSVIS